MRFGLKLMAALLPWALLAGWAECRLRQLGNGYTQKHTQLMRQSRTVQILAIGDSEMEQGFAAPLVPHAFNLAHPSQPIYYDSVVVDHYLSRLPALREIVLSVGPHRLNEDRLACGSRRHIYDAVYTSPTSIEGWLRKQAQVLQLSPHEILEYLTHDFPPLNPADQGWRYGLQCQAPGADAALARYKGLANFRAAGETARNVRRLQHIALAANRRGVAVTLIIPPLSSHYRRLAGPDIAQTRRMLQAAGLRVMDASTTMPDTAFEDTDHLCQAGAVAFTRRLGW